MTQIVILAGGLGTRLRMLTGDRPKPLVNVSGKPLLGRQLELIAASGFRDVVLLTGYGAEAIAEFCTDGAAWNLRIRCIAEQEARGTAGAVLHVLHTLAPCFVVLYGDTVLDVDLNRLVRAHERHAPAATLFLHPNDHPFDSDIVEVDARQFVKRIRPHPHPVGEDLPNLVNAGLYVIERSALAEVTELPQRPDFGKHVFARMLAQGMPLFGYRSPEYIKDAGTPDRLATVCRDVDNGRAARLSLRTQAPAVFLDRDGVLNKERSHIRRPEDLVLYPGVATSVAMLNRSDYRTIVVTNQAVIARGDCTQEDLGKIHARLDTMLSQEGAYLDAIYFCPHHPDKGFPGEIAELKIACECRKPQIGMISRAVDEFRIDLARSWLVGDTTTDMELARRCGIRSILVRTGHAGRDAKYASDPDFVVPDLPHAVSFILEAWPKLERLVRALVEEINAGEVILVGGSARSGKSSVASVIRLMLRDTGRSATVITLDHWLRSEGERQPGVLGRYDMLRLEEAIATLTTRRTPILCPRYDPLTRQSHPAAEPLATDYNEIIIVEGVPALASAALRAVGHHLIFVDCNENDRRRRFYAEYSWRGLPANQIEDLYSARNEDELPLVRASAVHATMIMCLY